MSQTAGKAVIWDMDGVIVDTGVYHFEAWREFFAARGRAYGLPDFHQDFGRRNADILGERMGVTAAEEIELLCQEKESLFRSRIKDKVTLLPGVRRLLDLQRKEHFGIALASSAPAVNIDFILSSLGIAACFDAIVSAADVTRGKPDPQCFLLAAQKLGVVPRRCVVIEDATVGITAAKAAGMKCIAVTTTHVREALAKADLVTDNLERITSKDLSQLLDTIA